MENRFQNSEEASYSNLNEPQIHESPSLHRIQKSEKLERKPKIWKIFNVFAKLKKLNKSKVKYPKSTNPFEDDQVNTLSNNNSPNQESSKSKYVLEKPSAKALDITPEAPNNSNAIEEIRESENTSTLQPTMDTPFTEIFNENDIDKKSLCASNSFNEGLTSNESADTLFEDDADKMNTVEDSCFHLVLKSNYAMVKTPINTPKKSIHNKTGLPPDDLEEAKAQMKIDNTEVAPVGDSTLGLLEIVRSKLKCFVEEPDENEPEEYGLLEDRMSEEKAGSQHFLNVNAESLTNAAGVRKISLNTIQNLYANTTDVMQKYVADDDTKHEIDENKTIDEIPRQVEDLNNYTENETTYSILESDIKSMIQDLLNASNDIKTEVIQNGIAEYTTPPFTYDVVAENGDMSAANQVCSNVLNDILTKAICEKNKFLHKAKHFNVTFKQDLDVTENIRAIIDDLLDNIEIKFTQTNASHVNLCANSLIINYCMITDNIMRNRDFLSTLQYHEGIVPTRHSESKLYRLTNAFLKSDRNEHLKTCRILKLPTVTVSNLSGIKQQRVEDKLVNRIKRSSALLLALYDEMRDYSYYACTNLLSDLYEKMSKSNGQVNCKRLIVCTERNKREDGPETEGSDREGTDGETDLYFPGPSSDSSLPEMHSSHSIQSLYSDSEEDEINTKSILPHLKYIHVSEEEINTPEEIKKIEKNVDENDALSKMKSDEFDSAN